MGDGFWLFMAWVVVAVVTVIGEARHPQSAFWIGVSTLAKLFTGVAAGYVLWGPK